VIPNPDTNPDIGRPDGFADLTDDFFRLPDVPAPKLPGNPTLAVVETAFLAGTGAIAFVFNTYFPIVGVGWLIRTFYALPIALTYLRWGYRTAWKTATVTALLVVVLMGPIRSLQFLIPHGLLGVWLGYLWRRGVPWSWSLGSGVGLGVAGSAFQLALLSLTVGENLWVYFILRTTNFIAWLGFDRPEVIWVQALTVVSLATSSAVYLLLIHGVAWLLFDRIGHAIPAPPPWIAAWLR